MKKITDDELSKQDLEDMKHIFTQDDNEILDIPSMINRVHVDRPKLIDENITLEEPSTYTRRDHWRRSWLNIFTEAENRPRGNVLLQSDS